MAAGAARREKANAAGNIATWTTAQRRRTEWPPMNNKHQNMAKNSIDAFDEFTHTRAYTGMHEGVAAAATRDG